MFRAAAVMRVHRCFFHGYGKITKISMLGVAKTEKVCYNKHVS